MIMFTKLIVITLHDVCKSSHCAVYLKLIQYHILIVFQ